MCWSGDVEDERHFLLDCSALSPVRQHHALLFEALDELHTIIPDKLHILLLEDRALKALAMHILSNYKKFGAVDPHPPARPPWNWIDDQHRFLTTACQLINSFITDISKRRRSMRILDAVVNPYFKNWSDWEARD